MLMRDRGRQQEAGERSEGGTELEGLSSVVREPKRCSNSELEKFTLGVSVANPPLGWNTGSEGCAGTVKEQSRCTGQCRVQEWLGREV